MNDNEALKDEIEREITQFFFCLLKDAELLSSNDWRYNKYRKHVLDAGNNAIRNLQGRIDAVYTVERNRSVEKIVIEEE